MSILPKDRHKFTPRAESCVFLGCPSGIKGYKVLNIDTQVVSVSRNVIFHGHDFPYKHVNTDSQLDNLFSKSILPLSNPIEIDSVIPVHSHASTSSSSHVLNVPVVSETHACEVASWSCCD